MKTTSVILSVLSVCVFSFEPCPAQNTVFTYQGRVRSGGSDFTGNGQFKFALVTSSNVNHQATATANPPSGGFITTVNVTFGGNGYVSPPAVTFFGGGGANVAAHAVISGGVVTSIIVDNPGSGYASAPTVIVAPPPVNLAYMTYWSNDGTSVNGSEPSAAVSVSVNNGLFTVVLGDTTQPNMVAINVSLFTQPNLQLRAWFNDGVNGFSVLNPAQSLTPAPYSTLANSASNLLGALPANQVSGALTLAQLPVGLVTNNQSGVNFSGAFTGNASGLTNLPVNSLALTTTNISIVGWGYDLSGQTTIPAGLSNVTKVAAGGNFSLALKADGTVAAWGFNGNGETNVPPGLNSVTAFAAGENHGLAAKADGTVVAWGYNGYAQTNVPPGLINVVAVAAGARHSLALKNNGTLVAWGDNGLGQTNVPAGLNNFVAIAAGGFHNLALKSDGTVVAWGYNTYGQTNTPPGLSNVVAVAAGGYHSLALKSDGTVVAWGENSVGQATVPSGLSNVMAIAAGGFHSLALRDGHVVAWGNNNDGQTIVPLGLNSVLGLSQGPWARHSFAIRRQAQSPAAWLDLNNVFSRDLQVNGQLTASNLVAAGNVTILPPYSLLFGNGTRQMLNLWGTAYGIGIQSYGHYFRTDYGGGFHWFEGGEHSNNSGDPGTGGRKMATLDSYGLWLYSGLAGHSPAIFLDHSNTNGRTFRIASYGDNVNPGTFVIRDDTAGADRLTMDASGNVGIGTSAPNQKLFVVGNIYATGTITPNSDRNLKTDFAPVDVASVLEKVAGLPIQQWRFRSEDASTKHVGPMAQDFRAAFGLGEIPTAIATVDADGVALAAIQGLNRKVEDGRKQAEISSRRGEARIQKLEAENAELQARLEKLEKLLR